MVNITGITSYVGQVGPLATKLVGALLILVIGFVIGRLTGLLLRRVLKGANLDKTVRKTVGYQVSLEKIISGLVGILIYAAAIIMALNYLGLTTVVLTVFTTAIIVILAVSFLLSVKDFLPNAFAGLAIRYRKDFRVGDRVSVKGVDGVVKDVSLLSTTIQTKKDLLIVPNALFQKEGYKVKK